MASIDPRVFWQPGSILLPWTAVVFEPSSSSLYIFTLAIFNWFCTVQNNRIREASSGVRIISHAWQISQRLSATRNNLWRGRAFSERCRELLAAVEVSARLTTIRRTDRRVDEVWNHANDETTRLRRMDSDAWIKDWATRRGRCTQPLMSIMVTWHGTPAYHRTHRGLQA